ncbi:site-2 protease family protein [Fulvivirga sp. M361]|uniref:site-2 protease family protein n=1 Tax=Fulvivirga sp. M361 TaxID=2594266 RepID=UPI00117B637C|nr:site-2 protease family protein [Fulvivirga sp. M361]TRX61695.1 site-2 protease family protein [Fulvivirga sp. M361]
MDKDLKRYLVHIGLFLVTFLSTTFSGSFFIKGKMWGYTEYSWEDFLTGMQYSVPFLLILTVHEFGHYFTARYHKIKTTLPYYIPLPPFPMLIGTMGAVIRIKQFIKSKKIHFDIGLAGPLAGFTVAIGLLFYGYATLPPAEYIYEIHPEYKAYGENYAEHFYNNDTLMNVSVGKNLTILFFENMVADPERVPHPNEFLHYPYLFAGFLALFFTALNLLPIGQLDGGHVLYGLVGAKWHSRIAVTFFFGLLFYAGLGYVTPFQPYEELLWSVPLYIAFLFFALKGLKKDNQTTFMYALIIFAVQFVVTMFNPGIEGFQGWLLFGLLIGRFLGVYHPKSPEEEPLDTKRVILGWLTLIIFIISFSPAPLIVN